MKSFTSLLPTRIIVLLVIFTLAFIFVQSMLTPEASEKESDAVGEVVEEVIETVAPDNETLSGFIEKNIRKIAHFAEFGALGLEMAVFVFLWYCYRLRILAKIQISEKISNVFIKCFLSLVFGLVIATCDETIQLVVGRGPSVLDIWIDMLGFSSLFIVGFACMIAVRKIVLFTKKDDVKNAQSL